MTTLDVGEKLQLFANRHGRHMPVTIEMWEPTSDGLNLEPIYREITEIKTLETPTGRRVVALIVED